MLAPDKIKDRSIWVSVTVIPLFVIIFTEPNLLAIYRLRNGKHFLDSVLPEMLHLLGKATMMHDCYLFFFFLSVIRGDQRNETTESIFKPSTFSVVQFFMSLQMLKETPLFYPLPRLYCLLAKYIYGGGGI